MRNTYVLRDEVFSDLLWNFGNHVGGRSECISLDRPCYELPNLEKKRVFAHFPATPICNGDLQPLCRDGFILALLEASWRLTSICYDPFHCFECERPFPRMRCFTDPR